MSANSSAAGWYPDPTDDSWSRYWDGSAWTGKRGPRYASEGKLFIPPAGPLPPVPRFSMTSSPRPSESASDKSAPDKPVPGNSGAVFYSEQLKLGTFVGAAVLAFIAVIGGYFLLLEAGVELGHRVGTALGWTVGVVVFLALSFFQLTVNPAEIKCPKCGKQFREGRTTCRQCGYTQPSK
jgi:hypothetical protein